MVNLIGNVVCYIFSGVIIIDVYFCMNRKDMEKENLFWVIVIDMGIGIVEGDLFYVFEWFWWVDKFCFCYFGGMGLGLAIVKWLVEL